MQVWPRTKLRLALALALALVALAGLAVAFAGASPWLVALAAVVAGLGYWNSCGRYLRRRRLTAEPFPATWRRTLLRRVDFYRRLNERGDAEALRRFEDDVRIFLAEQTIYGAGPSGHELELDDETRLLIAASAAMLGHGMPRFEWPRMRDIVVHPRSFDEDYRSAGSPEAEHANISGMVHHQGPILYSERDLKHGFRRRDGHNVGLHELAHVLDLADGYADGVPVGASWVSSAPWVEIVSDRLTRLRRRQYRKVLRAYAGTNEAEFFAVAVEVFFEQPRRLHERDPELYAMLADYFGQDPAEEQPPRRASRRFR